MKVEAAGGKQRFALAMDALRKSPVGRGFTPRRAMDGV